LNIKLFGLVLFLCVSNEPRKNGKKRIHRKVYFQDEFFSFYFMRRMPHQRSKLKVYELYEAHCYENKFIYFMRRMPHQRSNRKVTSCTWFNAISSEVTGRLRAVRGSMR